MGNSEMMKPAQMVAANYAAATAWRRQLHQNPQPAWLEFYATAFVAEKLAAWGYELQMGKDIINADKLMLLPDPAKLEEEYRRALNAGANETYLKPARGGLTGVVATLRGAQPGPVIGFRFDIDANEITEANDEGHYPVRAGFVSQNPGYAHMCGHDAHTAIGLLVAKCLADHRAQLRGTVKLIFQPNEENLSGAAAMVGKGVVDDLDYLLGGHVGVALKQLGQFSCRIHSMMALSRFEVTFTGRSAHAALRPDEGKNALQGACAAISNLYAIPRHGSGETRINVGYHQGGTGWNVIPDKAYFRMETRGVSNETNGYMVAKAREVIEGAAKMYGLEYEIKPAAVCGAGANLPKMIDLAEQTARKLEWVEEVVPDCAFNGSEDVTVFMDRVQEKGGKALFVLFGTPIHEGHHNCRFDLDEKVIGNAAEFFLTMQQELSGQPI